MTQLSRYICIPNLVFTCVQASHQCNGPLNPNLIVANEEPSTNCASLPVCHRQQLPPPRSANLLEKKKYRATSRRAREPSRTAYCSCFSPQLCRYLPISILLVWGKKEIASKVDKQTGERWQGKEEWKTKRNNSKKYNGTMFKKY